MSTSPMGANKPIEDIEASLLAAKKSALDELGASKSRRYSHSIVPGGFDVTS